MKEKIMSSVPILSEPTGYVCMYVCMYVSRLTGPNNQVQEQSNKNNQQVNDEPDIGVRYSIWDNLEDRCDIGTFRLHYTPTLIPTCTNLWRHLHQWDWKLLHLVTYRHRLTSRLLWGRPRWDLWRHTLYNRSHLASAERLGAEFLRAGRRQGQSRTSCRAGESVVRGAAVIKNALSRHSELERDLS